MVNINSLLKLTMERQASDLHITVNSSPIIRIDGTLYVLKDLPVLDTDDTKALIYSILNDDQKAIFEKDKELDFLFRFPIWTGSG
jgi:twitching motility protein PilT